MISKKVLIPVLLALNLFIYGCVYIVLPEGVESSGGSGIEDAGWAGIVTNVGESESGDLRIAVSIRNDTGEWSRMSAVQGQPAVLTTADGETFTCDTVFVGTGGHRLAPGFQIRGYTSGDSDDPETQLLYVECASAAAMPASELLIDYEHFDGELDYYVEVEETNKEEGEMVLKLDEVVTDLTYPVATDVEGVIYDSGTEIIALSENVISLLDVQRNDSGFQFTWQNHNPSKFPLKTHIGIPPVLGEDGVIYGPYVTIDMPEVPLTPAQASVEWTTEVAAPADVGSYYILLSVESNKPRTYLNYALDITDQ
jgi:hypothetical protein